MTAILPLAYRSHGSTMLAVVTPVAYTVAVGLAALAGGGLCLAARWSPGPWRTTARRALGALMAANAIAFTITPWVQHRWSTASDLPLALCNMGVIVAVTACWWPLPLLVELTWFWGLAGTIQAVITPDLSVGFPHREFFEYVIGHTGIVVAAVFLVVGLGMSPRPGSVVRVFAITASYTAFVGAVDIVTGADYMFLRHPPDNWTLLRLLGPWPWYIASAAGVALALLIVLDAPFWPERRGGQVSKGAGGP
jgi:hypothetical integral membrane protein (TIGR02206 family)